MTKRSELKVWVMNVWAVNFKVGASTSHINSRCNTLAPDAGIITGVLFVKVVTAVVGAAGSPLMASDQEFNALHQGKLIRYVMVHTPLGSRRGRHQWFFRHSGEQEHCLHKHVH